MAFEIETIFPIRKDEIFAGYRVAMSAKFDTRLTPLSIDVSTGDAITSYAMQISNVPEILYIIEASPELRFMWEKYRKQFAYAADIEYKQIMEILKTLSDAVAVLNN